MSAVHYELQYVNGQIEELESTFKTAEEARTHLKSCGLSEWIMAGGKHINPANVISIKIKEV